MQKLLLVLSFLVSFNSFAATNITVFAAASLTNALQDIAQQYHKQHPDTQVIFSFASSSTLAKQIAQGAEPDLYLSADQKWMDYLQQKQLIKHKITLLGNVLVLIAPKDSELQPFTLNKSTNWQQLLPAGERIAIGDPALVPAGIYAKEALTNLGMYQQLLPHFAISQNVRNALMLVERGETPLGIVYRTDALISSKVKVLAEFPAASLSPVEYPATVLTANGQPFFAFLTSLTAQTIFSRYGFKPYVAH